jgi:hypothetical protein
MRTTFLHTGKSQVEAQPTRDGLKVGGIPLRLLLKARAYVVDRLMHRFDANNRFRLSQKLHQARPQATLAGFPLAPEKNSIQT